MSKTSMTVPDVQYARSGEVAIAYQVVGRGPVDLVFVRAYMGDLTTTWQQLLLVRHVEGLASFSRVLMLDKRGTGLSDRMREVPTLETRMDDVRAVMDAAGSERAVIWTGGEGARLAALFAATCPERVAGLVLLDPSAKGVRTPDYPWARSEAEWRAWLAEIRARWGERGFFHELLRRWAPTGFRTRERSSCPGLRDAFTWVDDESHERTMRETERFVVGLAKPDVRETHRQGPRRGLGHRIRGSRGAHPEGVPGEWRLFAVARA